MKAIKIRRCKKGLSVDASLDQGWTGWFFPLVTRRR